MQTYFKLVWTESTRDAMSVEQMSVEQMSVEQTYFKLVWTESTRNERFNPLRGRSCQFHSLLSHINTVTNQTKDNQTRTKRGIRASRDCSLPGSKI